jgi:hypothetical protein
MTAVFISSVWTQPLSGVRGRLAFWNVLFDLNQSGAWGDGSPSFPEWVCQDIPVTLTPGMNTPVVSPPFAWPIAGGGPFGRIIFPVWARNMITAQSVKASITTAAGPPAIIFNNWNKSGVRNGPTQGTQFTIDEAKFITSIEDYHWNAGKGALPSTGLSLLRTDGTVFGPWPVFTSSGQGGAPNVNWECFPGVTIPPGTYTVLDPDPAATWSQNDESGNSGFSQVRGSATKSLGNWDGRGPAGGFTSGEIEDYFVEWRPIGQRLARRRHHAILQGPSAEGQKPQIDAWSLTSAGTNANQQRQPDTIEIRPDDLIQVQCPDTAKQGSQFRCNLNGLEPGRVGIMIVRNLQTGGGVVGEVNLTATQRAGSIQAKGVNLSATIAQSRLLLDLKQAPDGFTLIIFAEPRDEKRLVGNKAVRIIGGALIQVRR